MFITFEGFFSQRRGSGKDRALIFHQISRPSGLLVSTVSNEVVLSKTVGVVLQKVKLGIVVACGSLKLCERGGDRPCRTRGGITGAVALELG